MSETAQSIPMWQTVVGLLGLGSLIATGLSHWLSSRSDRRKWIDDNKKKEWRELIVELDGSFEQMSYAFLPAHLASATDARNNPTAGLQRGNRVLRDRIFIASALNKHGLLSKWQVIAGSAITAGSAERRDSTALDEFKAKASGFRDELLRVAQKDLGVN